MDCLRIPTEFVPPNYEKLLVNLSKRSRYQKAALHCKRSRLQIEQERRERDFCLYLNLPQSATNQRLAPVPIRSTSAPSYATRKPWSVGTRCNVRTEAGDIVTLTRSDYYSDDFESDDEEFDEEENARSDTSRISLSKDTAIRGENIDDNVENSYRYAFSDASKDIVDAKDYLEDVEEKEQHGSGSNTPNPHKSTLNAWDTVEINATKINPSLLSEIDEYKVQVMDSLEWSANTSRQYEQFGEYIKILIYSNWGDVASVGLSKIQVFLEGVYIPLYFCQVFSSSDSSQPKIDEFVNSPERRELLHVKKSCLPISFHLYFHGKLGHGNLLLKLSNLRYHTGVKSCEIKIVQLSREVTIFTGDLQQCQVENEFEKICFTITKPNAYRTTSHQYNSHLAFQNYSLSMQDMCAAFQETNKVENDSTSYQLDALWSSQKWSDTSPVNNLTFQSIDTSVKDTYEQFQKKKDNGNNLCHHSSLLTSLDILNCTHTDLFSGKLMGDCNEDGPENIQDQMNGETEYSSTFKIPELPSGCELLIDILSTWGDKHYVGLTGLQIFNTNGLDITASCSITTTAKSENFLQVENLLDGVNETKDVRHMWLTRFTPGQHHWLNLQLPSKTHIALLRVWNYNASRVHSSRGVRDVVVFLDDNCIFQGEISKALGCEKGNLEEFAETILFTTDEGILQLVAKHDHAYLQRSEQEDKDEELRVTSDLQLLSLKSDLDGVSTRWFDLEIINTWYDGEKDSMVGLTSVKAFGDKAGEIELPISRVQVVNRLDTSCLKLLNHRCYTNEEENMWCTNFDVAKGVILRFWLVPIGNFELPRTIFGIQLWNYNAPLKASCIGVKTFRLLDDKGKYIGGTDRPLILRRAPGHVKYDFSQRFMFHELSLICQPFSPILDKGFVLEVSLHSNWGDPNYIGLDRIELLNLNGITVPLTSKQVFIYPSMMSELDLLTPLGDNWNPIRLIEESTHEPWMTPITPNTPCQIFIIFDRPIKLIGLRLWNFSGPNEDIGVCRFSVWFDDKGMIFAETLKKNSFPHHCQTFLFS